MQRALILLLIVCATNPARAQDSSTPLADAAGRAAARMAHAMRASALQDDGSAPHRGWIARHPVLTGTLIGLGAGASIGAATCAYPGAEGPCSYYTFPERARTAGGLTIGVLGAGIGAGVGALIDLARR